MREARATLIKLDRTGENLNKSQRETDGFDKIQDT
jgi:hypothetical protein